MTTLADDWEGTLEEQIDRSLAAAGPRPDVLPVHMIEDPSWPLGALALCERAVGDTRPPPHGWHLYTNRRPLVTCQDCKEWVHA